MNVKVTSFDESEGDVRFVRDAVFGDEQSVLRGLDFDGNDPHCIHVVAEEDDGSPIGTGRIQADGRIGRLAVLKSRRNRGVGGKMLEALIESARGRGLEQVYLHAQLHSIPFYETRGFETDGAEFMEAGIRHVTMTRSI